MPDQRTSTLYATERSLRPLVLAVTYGSCTLVALTLGWTATRLPVSAWVACAVPALALEASNLHYGRTHALTTVGMIPVALFALVTPCCACLMATTRWDVLRGALCLVLAALLVVLVLFARWLWVLRRTYSSHPEVCPTAALIVLGGAIKHGRPCETLCRRLDVAERLWREHNGRTLVLSGGPTPDDSTTEAHEMARYLQEHGVDPSAVILEPRARNTRENIAYSIALLDERGHQGQRCVVTSDYHLWRALRDGRKVGAHLTPIAAPTPRASVPQQWCREVLTILSGR